MSLHAHMITKRATIFKMLTFSTTAMVLGPKVSYHSELQVDWQVLASDRAGGTGTIFSAHAY